MKINLLLILAIFPITVFAQSSYIDYLQKVTFRTGPGTDNKIIRMINTDEKVKIVKKGETWSKVSDVEGVEGYVLNRFLTNELPASIKYTWLKSKFDKLELSHKGTTSELKELEKRLKSLLLELETTQKNLETTTMQFEELKAGSSEYLLLKKKFDQSVIDLAQSTKKANMLKESVNTHYIKWFLAGGGVLFLGWFIGLISRKKKGYQSGISF